MTREEAIETLRANYPDKCYELLRNAVDIAIEALKAEPKRGRWIKKDGDFWECSECGQRIFSMSKQDKEEFHKWCGRCGAKMDEEEE